MSKIQGISLIAILVIAASLAAVTNAMTSVLTLMLLNEDVIFRDAISFANTEHFSNSIVGIYGWHDSCLFVRQRKVWGNIRRLIRVRASDSFI